MQNKNMDKLAIIANQKIKERDYWLNILSDLSASRFPYCREYTGKGRIEKDKQKVTAEFGRQFFQRLLEISGGSDYTLHVILVSGLAALLGKYTGQRDIIVWTPIYKQEMEGEFINTVLPLRVCLEQEHTFKDLLMQVKQMIAEAVEHQGYPIEFLARKSGLLGIDEGSGLLDTAILLQNIHNKRDIASANPDMLFCFCRTERSLSLDMEVEYYASFYSQTGVQRLVTHFENLLTSVLRDVNACISDVDIMSPEEKQLLDSLNQTDAAYPRGKTIHQLFEEQAEKVPDHIAVIDSTAVEKLRATSLQITYRRLNKQSNRLAGLLIEKSVLPDTIVGMMMERSVEMIIGIIGILKSGGAYLPIDPDYPQERIDYMLKDSGAELLVTTNDKDGEKVRKWEGERVLLEFIIHHSNHLSFHHSNHSSDLAYIIYTSGTTGKPKGVLIEHKNVVRLLFNDRFQFDFNERDVWSLFHSYSFDFSVWEMYGALLYGGRLVIIPRSTTLDPGEFLQVLKEQQVTILNQTPSAFYNLIYEELKQGGKKLNVRYVILGGEALQPGKLSEWQKKYPDTLLVNMFGITETTVHVSYQEIGVKEITEGLSNIGKPIPTLSTYIMDKNRHLMIPGTSGELCVGGEGVARGYLNRPELTAERFVANPYKTVVEERLYRSGDLVRLIMGDQAGQMEYLGRIDHQVQIRGFRVELGEIESLLLKHEHIRATVVIDRSDDQGAHYLCAYIVPDSLESVSLLDAPSLQYYLSQQLPPYMIPPYFVHLAEIPLSANGKVDRKKLPLPQGSANLKGTYIAPRTKEETILAEIWQEVLGLVRVGIDDNFFNVGGDSIKTIRLSSAINNRLNSHIKILDLYTHGTIRQLANLLDRREAFDRQDLYKQVTTELEPLKARIFEKKPGLANMAEDIYPMSDIEKGMVFYYMKNVGTGIYHDQFVYPVYYKDFDVKRFERAINLMMEKHSILRTAFNLEDFEESVSIVYKSVIPDFTYRDLSQLPHIEQQRWLTDFMAQDRRTPFTSSTAPLWRVGVFELGNGSFSFTLVFHHAILDGWSTASLVTEVHNTFLELENDPFFVPPRLKASYKDTVIEGLIERQDPSIKEYWRKELAEYKRLEFSETIKSKAEMGAMTTHWYNAGVELLEQLNHLADYRHTSIKNLCFGAYACFMNMFSYEDDIVVGVVTNNRAEKEDGDKVLGCFLNTVPVRLKIPRGITWKEYIELVERKMLEVKKHERLSLFEIAVAIGEKSKDRNPIFDSLFNFMDFHIFQQVKPDGRTQQEKEGRGMTPMFVENSQDTNTLFDFEVDITHGTVRLCPKYNRSAISDETVKRCCGYFLNILRKYIEEPDCIIRNDAILSTEEKEQVLYLFNDTAAPYGKEKTMHQLFEEQVLRSPERTAVIDRDGALQWTYKELNKRSNQLAGVLRKKGLKTGDLTAVIMDRSINMVAAVMGILKAGGAYVPLEPYLPGERIRKILEVLHIETIITNEAQLFKVAEISQTLPLLTHLICLDKILVEEVIAVEKELFVAKELIDGENIAGESIKNLPAVSRSEEISYIIFTSGSTGTPKGVVETHRPVINVIEWVNRTFQVGYPDKLLFVASLSFDLSVYDIFGILASGACLRVAAAKDIKDPGRLLDIIMNEGITFWDSAPAALQQLIPFLPEVDNYTAPSRLRLVFLSGDWIPVTMPDALREAFEGVQVISLGGATEATVWSNYYPIGQVDPSWPSIPYGKPIQNAKYYILDRNLEVCPLRVSGDLYIGGECLAKEYINDEALSAHKFIVNPFVPGEKIYRTGDIARWFEDGNMQFLGRKDHQVKIRGYRIELGEIESQLVSHPLVSDGIVLDRMDGGGNKYLCSYYVCKAKGEEIDREELKEYLSRELPEYMIPAYFIAIEKIPLTANGKLDRKALPEPELSSERGGDYAAPENETQKKLVEIWSQVLGVEKEKIGITADFFELGGHSLKAATMAAKIHKFLNLKISIAEIFKNPTIKGLSETLNELEEDSFESIQPSEKKEYYSLSYAQKRIYTALQLEVGDTSYNMATILRLIGELDRERIQDAFRELIKRHEILRTSFEIIGNEPVQKVHDKVEFVIEYSSFGEGLTALKNYIQAFNLTRAPLLRVCLSRIGNHEYAMMMDISHLISDGISLMLMAKDLMTLYNRKELPLLNIQYKDFSEWESRLFRTGYIKKQEDFWLDVFKGELPILELPTDFPRPTVRNVEAGDIINVALKESTKLKLDEMIAETNSTLFTILLAIYNVLLNKYSGQEDFVVGTVVTGRMNEDLENVMGVFINMLPLRNHPQSGKLFYDFLEEVKENTFHALENQDYPMEELVKKLEIRNKPGRHPLFDTEFAVNNIEFEQITIPDLKMERYDSGINFAKFDLHFLAIEHNNSLNIILRYSTELFKKTTAEKIIEHFVEITEQVMENPGINLDDIEITIDFISIKSGNLVKEQGDFNF